MARPRKQTYTLEMYLKKIQSKKICNDADVQRNFVWKKEHINELIVTVLTDDYIPPIILGEEDNSQLHIVDGGCRSAALMLYKYGNYKITSSIENSVIPYQKKSLDENGKVTWEEVSFDIKNRTYEQLPEELKEKFDEYQIETVIHESCDSAQISKYIKRYNNHVSMNTDQKAFTYIDKFAGRIHRILESRFFTDCSNYSETDKIKGGIERIIVETMICMNHFDNWKTQAKAACKYLNDNGTDEEFDVFENNIHRLEKIITDDIKEIFNKKDSLIFLTLFDRFSKLGVEDIRFAEFLRKFCSDYRQARRNRRGLLFDEIDRELSTKDKQVITDKLKMMEDLMLDFLHISEEEKEEAIQNQLITAEDIIREYVREDIDDGELELYEMITNDFSEVIEDIDSDFLADSNRPSFVALVGYIEKTGNEKLFSEWLPYFERQNSLLSNQKQNFLHMRDNFDQYCRRFPRGDTDMHCIQNF